MKKIRVIIVDDSAFIRRVYRDMLSDDPEIEVVGQAADPYEARTLIKQLNPDVITLDIEMPKMDGLSFLEKIMTLRPMPVVMSSTLTQKGADATLRALELGAIDVIGKPLEGKHAIVHLQDELISKVKTAARARVRPKIQAAGGVVAVAAGKGAPKNIVLAIGASTGGVEALSYLFERAPANLPPIVITQHMPVQFTKSFAERLNRVSALSVKEGASGETLVPGHAYLAPGDRHMEVRRASSGKGWIIMMSDGPAVSGHKPSVDVLFNSVANQAGEQSVGVILTGMGKDGAKGLLAMRQAGAKTLGQNEASCVVYGMPRAARMVRAVEKEISLDGMMNAISTLSYDNA